MKKNRYDSKNRILRIGESQRKDGRYAYKYTDNSGCIKFVYSWRLTAYDKTPSGKRHDASLREKETQILVDMAEGNNRFNKKMTVFELYKNHISQNDGVRPNTKASRNYLLKKLKEDIFGTYPIERVKINDVKEWVYRCRKNGYSYQSIKNQKRALGAAFQMAVQNEFIRKNPFSFNIRDVIQNDISDTKALSPKLQEEFLQFVKSDKVYSKYYDAIIIFLETGMRASELCGLTKNDVDMKKRIISVNHQLLKNKELGYYIAPPKTKSSYRQIYMCDKVYNAFASILKEKTQNNYRVDNHCGFIFLNSRYKPMTVADYDGLFRRMTAKFKRKKGVDTLPKITPHTMRHSFCTNMAQAGMNPKSLQYIMGHSDISMTLNYYSHSDFDFAKEEMKRVSA